MRELIEEHIGTPSHNVKDLAGDIQSKIDAAFKGQQHDSRASRIIENAVVVLGKFTSAVDVAINFDPAHAALPWALVRSVLVFLASRSELKNQVLTGMATVASLLVQCDTYQKLYMAPDLSLRPPKAALRELEESIIQAYVKSQILIACAIQRGQSKTGLVAGPFKLSGIQSYVDELPKCERQLVRAADDCERFRSLSLQSTVREYTQELLDLKVKFHGVVHDQIGSVLERIDYNDQTEILEWISPILVDAHHNTVKDARTSDTCEWLLAHEKFREWENASSSMILWLQGSPGAGKTFLASKVIDHIRARLQNSPNQEGFAFFYCNRNEEQRRQPLPALQSYVRQLSTTVESPRYIRRQLQELCREKRRNASNLGINDCREQLLASVNAYDQTTLVLDALDECEPDSRRQIVETIDLLLKSRNTLKIFMSSRPDRDIRNRFIHKPNIEIQAAHTQQDIRRFVNEEISKHENWTHMASNLKDNIISTLFTKSQGMFQWVFLQIKEILMLETERAIVDRLGKLPANLKIAYDEIYRRIRAQHEHDRFLADNAFKWVAAARKPLKSEQLLSMIRLDSEEDTFHLSEEISESQLLHLCNNLLVLDTERKVWRFSHLSVTEYFESNHWSIGMAHRHCAMVCLKALLNVHPHRSHDDANHDGLQEKQLNHTLNQDHSLQEYVHRHWTAHIEAQETLEVDPKLAGLLKSFLGAPNESSRRYQNWVLGIGSRNRFSRSRLYGDLFPETIALFVLYRFSFCNILRDWWEDPKLDLSQINKTGRNALAIAAKYGHKRNCENLIKLGIDVDLTFEGDYGSALAEAAAEGHAEIVELLVEKARADVDLLLPCRYGSALAAAASRGRVKIVQFLLESSALDINSPLAGTYGSALAVAAAAPEGFNTLETIKVLIQAGADVNLQLQAGKYGSALAAATASYKKLETVRFLVQAGADVNLQLQAGKYGSALAAAAAVEDFENFEIFEFLDQAGADINLQLRTGQYGSALAAVAAEASLWGKKLKIVKFLVHAGADINLQLQGGNYGNALAAAIAHDSIKVVEYLVYDIEVNVNQQIRHGRYGGSALAVAAYWGTEKCAEILIKAGAEVNLEIENGPFRTALQACQADVSVKDLWKGWYRNMSELKKGQARVAELLRQHGATEAL
ncbi:hypothetical protein O1611_g8681 [Lasiodiplodia mahajangana]|uniref:Uncharacterized protein n=1 Tax=Lasiodiplodia mahajangana TaxID=1108764 RepID=A0ACC2JC32_9PEZI|nr:hypothetical protein O1611_g8681 [Lasiodiplodia mahajangana]